MPKPRKSSENKPLKKLTIFCEGEKTEPNYINGYIDDLDSQDRKSVVQISPTRKNTAVQLVDEAIKAKKSSKSLPNDEFWVVYDREAEAKYEEEFHARAYKKAGANGINVAICNVCFEYWILLHLINTDAPYSSFDDLRRNSSLVEEMKKLSGSDYNKSSKDIFKMLRGRIEIARARGKYINKKGLECAVNGKSKPYHINPYVGIVDLLDAIDNFK